MYLENILMNLMATDSCDKKNNSCNFNDQA